MPSCRQGSLKQESVQIEYNKQSGLEWRGNSYLTFNRLLLEVYMIS